MEDDLIDRFHSKKPRRFLSSSRIFFSFFNSAIIYLRLLFRAIELSNENVEKFEERIGKRETEEFRFIDRAEHREYVHRAFYFPR